MGIPNKVRPNMLLYVVIEKRRQRRAQNATWILRRTTKQKR